MSTTKQLLRKCGLDVRRVGYLPFGLSWPDDVAAILGGELDVALDVGANAGMTCADLVLAPSTFFSTFSRGTQDGEETVTVQTITLDGFCEERGIEEVSLLKIDTEGHEAAVLRGAERLLGEHRVRTLVLECDFGGGAVPHGDFFEIHEILSGHGYSVVTFYTQAVNGNGWENGDVLYRLPDGDGEFMHPYA